MKETLKKNWLLILAITVLVVPALVSSVTFVSDTYVNITGELNIPEIAKIKIVDVNNGSDIQTKIDSVPNGGVVYIPYGVYTLLGAINITTDDLTLKIAGTLNWEGTGASAINVSGTDTDRVQNVKIIFEGGKLIRISGNTWEFGIYLWNVENTDVINGYVDGFNLGLPICLGCSESKIRSYNSHIIGGTYFSSGASNPPIEIAGCSECSVTGTNSFECGSQCMNVVMIKDTIISNNILNHTGKGTGDGMTIQFARDSIISENIILNSTGRGMFIGTQSKDVIISNNIIDNATTAGIGIAQADYINIIGNTIHRAEECIRSYNRKTQITIRGNTMRNCDVGMNLSLTYSTVDGNTIYTPEYQAIIWASPQYSSIKNNVIDNPSNAASTTYNVINITYDGTNIPQYFYIQNNIAGGGSKRGKYFVRLANQSNNYNILYNTAWYSSGFSFGHDASDTYTIADNYQRDGSAV